MVLVIVTTLGKVGWEGGRGGCCRRFEAGRWGWVGGYRGVQLLEDQN